MPIISRISTLLYMYDTPGLLLRRVQAELRAERHVDPAHEAPHRHQALHLQGVRPGEAGQGHGVPVSD